MKRKMVAVVIGNGAYKQKESELTNPKSDATDLAKILVELGFFVQLLTDCDNKEIDIGLKAFKDNLNSNDIGLFYYAGHGIQVEGENYITAIDTDFSEELSVKWSSLALNRVIDIMEKCSNTTNIIILDACRDNPYAKAWNRGIDLQNLAPIFAPKGTIIGFSTSPGEKASDGKGNNGPYTEALLQHIKTPDLGIEDVFKRVRNSLSLSTKGKQTSWEHTSLTGDFFFNLGLGKRINKYAEYAISDDMFILNKSDYGHLLIEKLKSHNWYSQNPALENANPEKLDDITQDTLFVIGRNIYQAAVGSSAGANDFIVNFSDKTNGMSEDKIINLLEGMLFEIFFNSKGNIRQSFKISKFNLVFELQKNTSLAPAFEFISECLVPYLSRFYVLPGKYIDIISVEIETKENENGENEIHGVYFEGNNIIRKIEESPSLFGAKKALYQNMWYSNFIDMLSEEMVIPRNKISVTSKAVFDDNTKILFPYNHTVSQGEHS